MELFKLSISARASARSSQYRDERALAEAAVAHLTYICRWIITAALGCERVSASAPAKASVFPWQTDATRERASARVNGTGERRDHQYYYEKRGRGFRSRICFARGDEAGGSESLQNRWAPAKHYSVLAHIYRRACVYIVNRRVWSLRFASQKNNAAVSRTSLRFADCCCRCHDRRRLYRAGGVRRARPQLQQHGRCGLRLPGEIKSVNTARAIPL